MSVIVTKVAITAPTPALIPDRLTTKKNTSSTVAGMDNSDTVTFAGSANFRTPAIAVSYTHLTLPTTPYV